MIKKYCVSCQVPNGIPTINNDVWGYYASRDGARILVVECRTGQRIRIDDAVEVVVLEISNGEVRFRINNAR